MRLKFPNGEHAEVAFSKGEVTFGSGADNRVSLGQSQLSNQHASIWLDRRGLWLRLNDPNAAAHVNARPVKRLASLRIGDQVLLGEVKIEIHPEPLPAIDMSPAPASNDSEFNDAQRAIASKAVIRQLSGLQHGRAVSLGQVRVLGRALASDIVLTDNSVPDRWAQIELSNDKIVLRNFTTQPVLVNGVSVREAVLAPGDQLVFASTRFVLEAPGMLPRGAEDASKPAQVSHTQTMKAVQLPAVSEQEKQEAIAPPVKNPGALWWLIAAAALVAVLITALMVFAPRQS
jgi:predicted component of type VI protein secretion system